MSVRTRCFRPKLDEPMLFERPRSAVAERTVCQWIAWFSQQTGLDWDCADVRTGAVVSPSRARKIGYLSPGFRARLSLDPSPVFYTADDLLVEMAIPLPSALGDGFVLTSHCLTTPGSHPLELTLAAVAQGWTNSERETYLRHLPTMSLGSARRFMMTVLDKLRLESREAALEHEVAALSQQLEDSTDEITRLHGLTEQDELLVDFVRTLVSTLDAKDPDTRGHSERVALIARRLGEQMGLSEEEQSHIYLSSLLHDIGKVGVDDRILCKPDQLTAEEFAQIQRHPEIGYQILKPLRHMQPILDGVRSHHEAYNGRGYPQGLAGEAIPLMARVIAVADSYDAMTSDRPYRRGMAQERVEDIFRRGSGEQWDRRVIEAYFAAREEIRTLCTGYSLADGNLLDSHRSSIWGSLGRRSSRSNDHHGSTGSRRDAAGV